jgi:hypothetical protein
MLLDGGADKDSPAPFGTALDIAEDEGHKKIVESLS